MPREKADKLIVYVLLVVGELARVRLYEFRAFLDKVFVPAFLFFDSTPRMPVEGIIR